MKVSVRMSGMGSRLRRFRIGGLVERVRRRPAGQLRRSREGRHAADDIFEDGLAAAQSIDSRDE